MRISLLPLPSLLSRTSFPSTHEKSIRKERKKEKERKEGTHRQELRMDFGCPRGVVCRTVIKGATREIGVVLPSGHRREGSA